MLEQSLTLVFSLAALLLSADKLVDLAVQLAQRLGVTPFVIGLTIISVGTSLPEVMASGAAALRGYPEIAVGNVVGSNICNVGLILGLPAVFAAISCRRPIVLREGAVMVLITLSFWFLAAVFGGISQFVGLLFLLAFVSFVYWALKSNENQNVEGDSDVSFLEEQTSERSPGKEIQMFSVVAKLVLSFVVLLLSSEFLVRSTVGLAQALGVSEGVIALSLIAFGTSLPELSVSYASARQGLGDVLVGNVLGSNITNLLLVLGVSASIHPLSFGPTTISLDIPLMTVFALLMVYFLFHNRGITRGKGLLLLSLYSLVIVRCVYGPV